MRFLLILFLLGPFCAYAQFQIRGRVLNDAGGAALAGASVYINNSTLGAVTDASGQFVLGPVKPGSYELIVSFVSFETIVHPVTISDQDLKFEFRLAARPQPMRNIYIMSSERRTQFLKAFREQFLGISYRADRCEILNLDDVMFEAGQGKDEIIAFADTPLVVVNKVLGYRISFSLQQFYFDQRKGSSSFYGFARYEELEAGRSGKWEKNRKDAYMGSSTHFYRSVYEGKAEENAFRIYRMTVAPGMIARESRPTPASAFLVRDSTGNIGLQWTGRLMVEYRKEPAGKAYLARRSMSVNMQNRGVESQIEMIHSPAWLSPIGLLLDPMSVRYSGYWGFEKLADMLPVNYDPGR